MFKELFSNPTPLQTFTGKRHPLIHVHQVDPRYFRQFLEKVLTKVILKFLVRLEQVTGSDLCRQSQVIHNQIVEKIRGRECDSKLVFTSHL